MENIGSRESFELASLILERLQANAKSFSKSGNLANSIFLDVKPKYIRIVIDAKKYNVAKWKRTGIIEYWTGKRAGSYASDTNNKGKHKGWVEKSYQEALEVFSAKNKAGVSYE